MTRTARGEQVQAGPRDRSQPSRSFPLQISQKYWATLTFWTSSSSRNLHVQVLTIQFDVQVGPFFSNLLRPLRACTVSRRSTALLGTIERILHEHGEASSTHPAAGTR